MMETNKTRARMSWRLRLLLIGSLGLNLLVFGVVGGATIGHFWGGERRTGPDHVGSPYARALDPQDRRALGKAIRQAYRAAEIDREADRRGYERVIAVLRSAPLDRDLLLREVQAQATNGARRRDLAELAWLEKVVAMSDAQRADYADQLEETVRRQGHKGAKKRE